MERARRLSAWLLAIVLFAAPMAASAQQRWSEGPEYTVVANPRAVDSRVVGTWDLWIPGAVNYFTDGRDVYRRYTPGAGRGRIVIQPDGRYVWDTARGRLVEVRPYFALDHLRYWLLKDRTGSYLVTYDDRGSPFRVLHTSGGILATGERTGGRSVAASAPTPAPEPAASPAPAAAPASKPAAATRPATPAAADNPLGVEWRSGATTAQPATPTPAAPAAPAPSNPLGVEWRSASSSTTAPPSTAPPASNPLGVDWASAPAPTAPAPTAPTPTAPTPVAPTPVAPPAPVTPPAPPTTPIPPAPPSAGEDADIAGVWSYQKMRFGPGADGEMGVRGTLVLRPDGSYSQELYIGEFVNPYRGSYRVSGSAVHVVNPVREERWTVQREGDRLLVTLAGTTPPAVYTLELRKACVAGAPCER